MKKDDINIVLFKKDLRLQDNKVLFEAIQTENPTLLLFIFEKKNSEEFNYSERQLGFIKESLLNLNKVLKLYDTKILVAQSEPTKVISILQQFWNVKKIFFHIDYDIPFSAQKYQTLSRFCKNNQVQKIEIDPYQDLQIDENKLGFNKYFNTHSTPFLPKKNSFIDLSIILELEKLFFNVNLLIKTNPSVLKGGPSSAIKTLENISKKEIYNQEVINKLSPFISWGNLSLRQLWEYLYEETDQVIDLAKFLHKIKWNIHYIQHHSFHKFPNIIFKNPKNLQYQNAWEQGLTGYPIIDAIMRCLKTTGNINYKMRMLTVLFYKQYLVLPWSEAVEYLSKNLLDSSSGIQFYFFETLNNKNLSKKGSISFNLIKHSKDIDPTGNFIKDYIPELRNIPSEFIYEPHKMGMIIQKSHHTIIGKDYPNPIIKTVTSGKIQLYNVSLN